MTALPLEMFYWRSNKEWYYIDKEKDEYVLTEKADDRVKQSFDMYCHPEKYGIHDAR